MKIYRNPELIVTAVYAFLALASAIAYVMLVWK